MSKEEVSKMASDRMKGDNNPMKRADVRAKVSASMLKNPRPMKYGREHYLWKGNRDRAQVIRTRLYPLWNKPIMEAADYTCSVCGHRGGRIEVHHESRPFRDILSEQLAGRILNDLSDDDFDLLVDKMLAAHVGATGIVYCVDCHEKKDPRRRLKGKKKDGSQGRQVVQGIRI